MLGWGLMGVRVVSGDGRDPPRSGLHPDVARTMRNTAAIQHFVYVSCNPDAFVDNAITYAAEDPSLVIRTGRPWRLCLQGTLGLIDGTGCVRLCRESSRRLFGAPFRPVKAVGVDLFPHTALCELVVLFERVPPEEQVPYKPAVAAPVTAEPSSADPPTATPAAAAAAADTSVAAAPSSTDGVSEAVVSPTATMDQS